MFRSFCSVRSRSVHGQQQTTAMFYQNFYNSDVAVLATIFLFLSAYWISGGRLVLNIFSPKIIVISEDKSVHSGGASKVSTEEIRAVE